MVIWKFEISKKTRKRQMPFGAQLLQAGRDLGGELVVWAEVLPDAASVDRAFAVLWTGYEVPAGAAYVGTVVDGADGLIYHVYDLGEVAP